MPTQTYEICNNKFLDVAWNWAQNGFLVRKKITWDDKNTTINSIKLQLLVSPNNSYTKFFVDLNGLNAASLFWTLGEPAAPKSITTDISPNNGDNDFNFVGAKEFANVDYVTFNITASVIVSYTGEVPHTYDEGILGIIEEYGGYAVVASVVFAVIALISRRR